MNIIRVYYNKLRKYNFSGISVLIIQASSISNFSMYFYTRCKFEAWRVELVLLHSEYITYPHTRKILIKSSWVMFTNKHSGVNIAVGTFSHAVFSNSLQTMFHLEDFYQRSRQSDQLASK